MKDEYRKAAIFIGIFIALSLSVSYILQTYNEFQKSKLSRWTGLCSEISEREVLIRAKLDMKMGQREQDWCRNTFYSLF